MLEETTVRQAILILRTKDTDFARKMEEQLDLHLLLGAPKYDETALWISNLIVQQQKHVDWLDWKQTQHDLITAGYPI